MTETKSAIVTFTGKSKEHILRLGGSASWKLSRARALKCEYVVCCRSAIEWVEGPEPHGSAFLVGRISDVVRSPENPKRWLIKISQYASVDVPEVWKGWRNPVRYTDLDALGIDPATLKFTPVSAAMRTEHSANMPPLSAPAEQDEWQLNIPAARAGLARTFGVPESAVEIIIRG
jgi:hypothetical protein